MLLGSRREPFLEACLATLEGALDLLAVDLNGSCPENERDLQQSALNATGRLLVEKRPFTNFAEARNHALGMLPPGEGWVLKVDADEVHDPEGLALLTRGILPLLPDSVGIVDAWQMQFMQSFRYVDGLERRHDWFLRRTPELAWSGGVHEQVQGVCGRRLAAPYIYGHYGYVRDPGEVLAKWKQYARLGDSSYDPEELDRAVAEGYLDEQASRCLRYPGGHPEALTRLRRDLETSPSHVARFDRLMEARGRVPGFPRWRTRLRILWRALALARALPRPGRTVVWQLLARLGRAI